MEMKRHNFEFLLASLLLLLIASPIVYDLGGTHSAMITDLGFSVVIILAVWSLHGSRFWFTVGIVMAVAGLLFDILHVVQGWSGFVLLAILCNLTFLTLTIVIAFRQLVRAHDIDMNTIMGAVCIYLLIGVIWSLLFAITEIAIPGSFEGIGDLADVAAGKGQALLYYSFVTLTTLGYGDILPVSATARGLAYTEAILGQFYIAVLVAGLVSILASKTKKSD
ncbi:MAG: hypothetical protein EP297_00945 [Gammaproteobacteria bacterium]|nr:MAG: hypothetical protein EP297_00945 [Gammaproteobacteria bacterium]